MDINIIIRALEPDDCSLLSEAFKAQGWNKPESQYRHYLELQSSGKRDVLLAAREIEIFGYLTISWTSDYLPFQEKGIPDIVDFNVFKKYQRQGVGSALMEEAERRIKQRSNIAGIGVGLTSDYGPAHILYTKRGYIPTGAGLTKNGRSLIYGEEFVLDDDLVLHFIKEL